MNKSELLARYNDEKEHCNRLYNELQQTKKDLDNLAEFLGNVLEAAYNLGITKEEMTNAIKKEQASIYSPG